MKKTIRISRNFADLGDHLLNITNGDLYEIDQTGREIINALASADSSALVQSETYSYMRQEGIIIDAAERSDVEKFHLQWHLTNACNLRCHHCYDWKLPITPMTFDQMLHTIDNFVGFLKKIDADGEISLTGGEPMLFEKLPDLIRYIKEQDVFIALYVLSNGIICPSDTFIEFLKEHRVGIQISIDGMQDIHDDIRGVGSYAKSIATIKKLLAYGINTSVHYVIMKKNATDVLSFINTMEDLGVQRVHFSNLVPIGPGAQEEMLDAFKSKEMLEMIAHKQETCRIDIIGRRPLWTHVGSSGFCPVGFKTLTIDANGDFLPCRRLPVVLGNAKRDSFFLVWFTSEFLKKMREREKYVEVCGTCPKADDCGGCRAIANAVSGNPFSADPSCWLLSAQNQ